MIEVHRHGKTVLFDETGIDPQRPGLVQYCILHGYFYEEIFLEHIRRLGRRGAYVDVGSYVGTHTLYFAMLCDASHVYAFEPRPDPRVAFERHMRANGLESKVTLSPLGLASKRKTATVTLDRRPVTFECAPLDELLTDPSIAVVKIDVEGMELDVLRGATRILRESRPVLYVEANEASQKAEIADYLASFDYVWTGRAFNRSPQYEFLHVPDACVRRALNDAVASAQRREGMEENYGRLEAEVRELDRALARSQRRLAKARGSLAFRVGRATTVALRDAGRTPWRIPARWVDVFRGGDEILDANEADPKR